MNRNTLHLVTRDLILSLAVVAPLCHSAGGAPLEEMRTFDDRLVDIGTEAPYFGGMYLDEETETIVAYLADGAGGEDSVALREAILSEFTDRERATNQIVIRPARYTILELHGWYRRIVNDIDIDGIVFADMNEALNRVELGISVDIEVDDSEIAAWLARLGVPREAVIISRSEPVRELLQNWHRPVVGGLQNVVAIGGGTGGTFCTLGFTTWHYGEQERGFVTNSHCTLTYGAVDGQRVYQPNRNHIGWLVGTEWIDPAPFTNAEDSNCPPGRECRYSDAAWIMNDDPQDIEQGYIARVPLGFDPSHDAWNGDRFTILWTATPFVGMTVKKVGRTTGLTRGTVQNTCVIVWGNITRLCQVKNSGIDEPFLRPGDSGSPVFRHPEGGQDWAALVGILWGIGGDDVGYFSPWSGIRDELGWMEVCAPGIGICPQ